MTKQKQRLQHLLTLLEPACLQASIGSYIHFDEQTIAPPVARAGILSDLKAFAERMSHEAFTTEAIGREIEYLDQHNSDLSILDRRIVKRLALCYRIAKAMPPEFVERFERAKSKANIVWQKARKENDSDAFMPEFRNMLALSKEWAGLLGGDPNNGDSLYEALLPIYEPDFSLEEIENVVSELKAWLIPFLRRIQISGIEHSDKVLKGHFDVDRQRLFAEFVARRIGYDMERGHIGLTTHPFMSTLGPGDCRITMRMYPEFISACFFAVMHEAGHALYEQSVDPLMHKIRTSGLTYSHGIHEASSRMFENMVGRSRPFLEFAYPALQALFPQFYDVSLDTFYAAVNRVEPSFIRVEADELTYQLHIILRFELELKLMRGEISPEDVPAEWDRLFYESFGVHVDKPANGWLQDVHWSYGYFGYFVTYLLGNLTAAQLFDKFTSQNPSWAHQFRSGNMSVLVDWMQRKVYRFGHVMPLNDAVLDATGEFLSAKSFITYAEDKFGELYKL